MAPHRGGVRRYRSQHPARVCDRRSFSIADDATIINTLLNAAEFKALLDVRYSFILHVMQEYHAAYQAADDILLDISNDGNP